MYKCALTFLGAVAAIIIAGWIGVFDDLRELPRWADTLITIPVLKIAPFFSDVFFHGKADAEGIFGPVAFLYCASIGALSGLAASFLFTRKKPDDLLHRPRP
jgi:hypothetical protein